MKSTDLAVLTEGRIARVWYCPPNDGRQAVLLVEGLGGPKRYRRMWLDHPTGSDDWTWFRPDDALALTPGIDGEDDVTTLIEENTP